MLQKSAWLSTSPMLSSMALIRITDLLNSSSPSSPPSSDDLHHRYTYDKTPSFRYKVPIGRINLTNINTKNAEGLSITQLIAKKDTLTLRIGILRNIYSEATNLFNRYSSSEIRQECVIDVKQLSKQIDDYSSRLRKLDMEIQGLNFLTELM